MRLEGTVQEHPRLARAAVRVAIFTGAVATKAADGDHKFRPLRFLRAMSLPERVVKVGF